MSSQPPLNIPLHVALPTRGQDPAPPTRGQVPVPPTRNPAQVSGAISLTRGQTPEARGTTILHSAERRPKTQKVRQNEMAEKYVPDEGTR